MNQDIRKLWTLSEPYVNDAGFELVEVQSGREAGTGWVVRLFIDRPPRPRNVNEAVDALLAADGGQGTGQREGAGEGEGEGNAGMGGGAGGAGTVSLEDCARVSRDVSAALDVADLIKHAYVLEVSSPGLDRPLRREQDFARFAGQKARIRMVEGQVPGAEGRRNFSGTLRGAKEGRVEIECDGRSYQLPVEDVAKANLVPDWDSEFKRSAS